MFKWSYSETVKTDATAEQIWSIWKEAELWPKWDSELSWVKINGPFHAGTQGKMQPTSGPIVEFTLTEVEKNKRFVDRARLPLTTLYFLHVYEENCETKRSGYIRHSIIMKGFLVPLFRFVIGKKIEKHLRGSMENLCALAEKTNVK